MPYRHQSPRRSPSAPAGRPDVVMFSAITALCVFGLFALASASSIYSYQRYGNTYAVVLRQLIAGGIPGVVLFGLFFSVDYRRWARYRWVWLLVTLGLLGAVLLPGVGVVKNGARSWIGFGPVSFQPAEVVKLTALLFLAAWLAEAGYQSLQRIRYGMAPFLVFAGLTAALIAAQPDLGTLLVVGMILAVTYFASGARLLHVLLLVCASVVGLLLVFLSGGYRAERLSVFLNPGLDPQGVGYHITQAYLAIGSGGWFGRGLGKSHQKFSYLPEVSADSIFAVVAEELGFVVTVLVVAAIALVVLRALRIARRSPDPFGRFLAVGVATWFGFQSFLNIAVMVGLAPLTGLPLPFISAGGTALASNLAAAGLLLNISRQTSNN